MCSLAPRQLKPDNSSKQLYGTQYPREKNKFVDMSSNNPGSYVQQAKDKAQEAMDAVTGSPASKPEPKVGGSEVDTYGSHFGLGNDGLARVKQAASMRGEGAEQDIWAGKMGLLDGQRIQQAKDAMFNSGTSGAEQDRYQARFGLGNDGLERVKALAATKGSGSEVDRYVSSDAYFVSLNSSQSGHFHDNAHHGACQISDEPWI